MFNGSHLASPDPPQAFHAPRGDTLTSLLERFADILRQLNCVTAMAELLRGLTTIRVATVLGRVSAVAVETGGELHRPLMHRPCQTATLLPSSGNALGVLRFASQQQ